jgi:hypothetical protein
MHIEKNIFKNIFNSIIDVKGKIKENIKTIIDIALLCHRKNMKLVYVESQITKLKASFALNKNT